MKRIAGWFMIVIFFVQFILFDFSVGCAGQEETSAIPQWPMENGNSQRTDYCPYSCSDNPGRVIWTYGPIDSPLSRPVIDYDGTIYIGDYDNKLHAINPDGSRKWVADLSSEASFSPSIDPFGRIVIGTYGGHLECFDREGNRVWSFKCNGTVNTSPIFTNDGTIYVCTRVGYDIINGETIEWGEDRLYAVNSNGREKWSFSEDVNILSDTVLGLDGTVYVETNGLVALYPNGTVKWTYSEPVYDPLIVRNNGDILVDTWNGIDCISSEGELKWSASCDFSSHTVASDNGLIYAFSDDSITVISEFGDVNNYVEDVGSILDCPEPMVDRDGNILWNGDFSLELMDGQGNVKWKHIPHESFEMDLYYGFYVAPPVITKDGTILYYCHPIDSLVALGPAPPAKVKGLQCTSVYGKTSLKWSYEITMHDSPSDYQNIDGFKIYRRSLPDGEFAMIGEVGPKERKYIDDDAPNDDVEYRVTAYDGEYESEGSPVRVENYFDVFFEKYACFILIFILSMIVVIYIIVAVVAAAVRRKRKKRENERKSFFLEE